MTAAVPATIRWLSASEGGRGTLPVGPEYRTVVRFEDAAESYPTEAWSLEVRFVRSLDRTGHVVLTEICFVVDEAPKELLRAGARFELREGRRTVAKGVVLPSTVVAPQQIDEFATALLG